MTAPKANTSALQSSTHFGKRFRSPRSWKIVKQSLEMEKLKWIPCGICTTLSLAQQAHLLLASWQPAAWYLSSSLWVGAGKWSGKAGCHLFAEWPKNAWALCSTWEQMGTWKGPLPQVQQHFEPWRQGGHSELQLASSWQGSWLKVSSWHQCSLGSLEAKSWEARLQCLRFLEEMWPQQNRFLQASWCFAPIALKEAAWPCTY